METQIYALHCPLTFDVRYVGKTYYSLDKRLSDHLYKARNPSTHVGCWIKSLLNNGETPIIGLIETVTSNWEDAEIFWIDYYSKIYDLCNHSTGGEGAIGVVHNKEKVERLITLIVKLLEHGWTQHRINKNLNLYKEYIPNLRSGNLPTAINLGITIPEAKNKIGGKGYSFNKESGKWIAYSKSVKGKRKYLGSFKTKQEAIDSVRD